eukprot:gene1729-498_t
MAKKKKEQRKELIKKQEKAHKNKEKFQKKKYKYDEDEYDQDTKLLNLELNQLGLSIKNIHGDGNCLFRSVSDQIEKDQEKYPNVRHKTVNFIKTNRENFEPFIYDETFEEYIDRMKQDGEWGGNLELQAISNAYQKNIKVYQYNAPILQIFFHDKAETIHLSYHNGDHYNSVIMNSDKIQKIHEKIEVSKISKTEKIIMESTGCKDIPLIKDALQQNWNDMDATIDYIFALQNDFSIKEEEPEFKIQLTKKEKKIMNKTGCNDIQVIREVYEQMGFDVEATIDYLSVNLVEQEYSKKEKVEIEIEKKKESKISKKKLNKLELKNRSIKNDVIPEIEESNIKEITKSIEKLKVINL